MGETQETVCNDSFWKMFAKNQPLPKMRNGGQLCRLKELEKENERLRRAVSDLTLDKQILSEAAKGNF